MSLRSPHAAVFRDMFAVGTAQDSERVEDCPVVLVYDKAKGMTHFLRAIYDRKYLYPFQQIDFAVISALFRLGQKYQAKSLYDDTMNILRTDLPLELQHKEIEERIVFADGQTLEFVRLAYSAHLRCFLPHAFYLCWLFVGMKGILEGVPMGGARAEALSPYEQRVCIEGNLKIRHASYELLRDSLLTAATGSGSSCFKTAVSLLQRRRPTDIDATADLWQDDWAEGLCIPCLIAAQKKYEQGREQLWNDLPSFYDLPSWEELRAQSVLSV